MSGSGGSKVYFDNSGVLYSGLVGLVLVYAAAIAIYLSNPSPLNIQMLFIPVLGFNAGLLVFWAAYLLKGRAFRDQQYLPDLIRSLYFVGGSFALISILGELVGNSPQWGTIIVIVGVTLGLGTYLRKKVRPVEFDSSDKVHRHLGRKYEKSDIVSAIIGFAVGAALVVVNWSQPGENPEGGALLVAGIIGAALGVAIGRRIAVARGRPETRQKSQPQDEARTEQRQRKDDAEFGFDERAWGGANEGTSTDNSTPDYASALRDARQEADKISDQRAAKFAKVWEKLAKEPGLDPKIKLFRDLVAMLLNERAKGFKGRPDQTEATPEELTRLISAKPEN